MQLNWIGGVRTGSVLLMYLLSTFHALCHVTCVCSNADLVLACPLERTCFAMLSLTAEGETFEVWKACIQQSLKEKAMEEQAKKTKKTVSSRLAVARGKSPKMGRKSPRPKETRCQSLLVLTPPTGPSPFILCSWCLSYSCQFVVLFCNLL